MELKGLATELRKLFPHGHPDFIPMTIKEMELHSQKNFDYAGGGPPLGNFDRRAKIYSLYPGLDLGDPTVVVLVDLMKQLDAALWIISQKIEVKIEGVPQRLFDVSVYSKIGILEERDKEKNEKKVGETLEEVEDRLKIGL